MSAQTGRLCALFVSILPGCLQSPQVSWLASLPTLHALFLIGPWCFYMMNSLLTVFLLSPSPLSYTPEGYDMSQQHHFLRISLKGCGLGMHPHCASEDIRTYIRAPSTECRDKKLIKVQMKIHRGLLGKSSNPPSPPHTSHWLTQP